MSQYPYWLRAVKSLRNNYLSLLVLSAFLILSVCSYGQDGNSSPKHDTTRILQAVHGDGFDYDGVIRIRGGLPIPQDTFKLKARDSGAIAYKGGYMWQWSGRKWNYVGADATPYIADVIDPLQADSLGPQHSRFKERQSWQDSIRNDLFNTGRLLTTTKLISTGGLSLDGATLTIAADIVWQCEGVEDTRGTDYTLDIPSATDGFHRVDLIYIDCSTGLIDTAQGVEDSLFGVAPVLQDGWIPITYVHVYGSTITDPNQVSNLQRLAVVYIDPITGKLTTDSTNFRYDPVTRQVTLSGKLKSLVSGNVAFEIFGGSGFRAVGGNGRLYIQATQDDVLSSVYIQTGSDYQHNAILTAAGAFIISSDTLTSPVSSKFTVRSQTKGSIPAPKMIAAEMNAIANPTVGLLVWNLTDSTLYEYRGFSGWSAVRGSGGGGGSQDLQSVTDEGSTTTNSIWVNYLTVGNTSDNITVAATNIGGGNTASGGLIDAANGTGNVVMGNADNATIKADDVGGIAMGSASGSGKIYSTGGAGNIAVGFAQSSGVIQADDAGSMALGVAAGDSLFTTGAGSIVLGQDNVNNANQSLIVGSGLRNYGSGDDDRQVQFGWDGITRFFVSHVGNVGINTLTPLATLHVAGKGIIGQTDNGGTITSTGNGSIASGNASNGAINATGDGAVGFGYAQDNDATINSGGTSSFAFGFVNDGAKITTNGTASVAAGDVSSALGLIETNGTASFTYGLIDASFGTDSLINNTNGSVLFATNTFGNTINTGDGAYVFGSGFLNDVPNVMTWGWGSKVFESNQDSTVIRNNTTVYGNVTATQFRVSDLNTAPANATDTGVKGEIRITADYIYICIDTDVWMRSPLETW